MLLHLVIILGVTFAIPKLRDLSGVPTLEITLVQVHSEEAPANPDFLAQANQAGGGDSERSDIARTPLPVWELSEEQHRLPHTRPAPQTRSVSEQERDALLHQETAPKRLKTLEPEPEQRQQRIAAETSGLVTPRTELQTERARLIAELDRNWQAYQKRPKRKFLNARTKEYKYAAYMEAWRAKVERVGNLNYPKEAKLRRISGRLRLDVALNPDGSVNAITLRESSGHKLLDDAAQRIVELAAPFAPFSDDIRAETDILHITRTWKFNDNLVSSEN